MVDALTYKIAKCCAPQEDDAITGYFKEDGTITVHDATCNAVQGFRTERLLNVTWDEIQKFKEDGTITVHDATCNAVQGFRTERLLNVTWDEIQKTEMPADSDALPPEFAELDETDYFILKHHQELGMDYSIVVAETLRIPLEEMHQRHRKLRDLGGLKRVEGRIIHYRKNIVKGKWIKHRNHTYYELTPEGKTWIQAFENQQAALEA